MQAPRLRAHLVHQHLTVLVLRLAVLQPLLRRHTLLVPSLQLVIPVDPIGEKFGTVAFKAGQRGKLEERFGYPIVFSLQAHVRIYGTYQTQRSTGNGGQRRLVYVEAGDTGNCPQKKQRNEKMV